MIFKEEPVSSPQLVKKFYFIEYFYILLKSAEHYSDKEKVFENFKNLKHKFQLGESKYKKLTQDVDVLSETQITRYRYTFDQVISEANSYGLIREKNNEILLKDFGIKALNDFEKGKLEFNKHMLQLMESKYNAFYHLIKLCYKSNEHKQGVLILPVYSPLKLGFKKDGLKNNTHIYDYLKALTKKLESDIKTYTHKKINLTTAESILIDELIADNYISNDLTSGYDSKNYNSLLKKVRSYWLNFFLKSIYNYTYSFDTFNIWVERGKQLGVLHSTEFYPNLDGRMVYPTSIISQSHVVNEDFLKVYEYENKEVLYIHRPQWKNEKNRELFVKTLVDTYFDLKRVRGNLFINLSDLKEKVCFKIRIPGFLFDQCLEETYHLNLKDELHIQISLEADRLPQETSAMYLKREPVLVNGKYKNIIAIDYKK